MQRNPIKTASTLSDFIPGIACMLLMFQAYLVAPLSASLAGDFKSDLINLAVPAFAIPFAIAAGSMVLLKPSVHLSKWLLLSLAALCVFTFLLSLTGSVFGFLLMRALTGYGTGAMLPSALLLAIRPSEQRRSLKPMVLIIFALATGMTFGPSLGGWLNGLLGWRWLFRCIALLAALLFFCYLIKNWQNKARGLAAYQIKAAARSKSNWKSRYSYSFIYLTGVFHSGVFVWISYYFSTQYGLDEFQIATELFIFGLPGFLLTLLMYFYQMDKKVLRILHIALGLTGAGLLILMHHLPLWLAECVLGIMSLGFGCSQPLFIGVLKMPRADISPLGPVARGSGLLFAGYGFGPLIIIPLLSINLSVAMIFLILLLFALAYISRRVWKV